ncbi:MAG: lamin tail domain-containing protein [Actinobacteria bacterium]|nr:lamin tail domain-containing protein [Actinomycetota bacterium]
MFLKGRHQELGGANAARDELLGLLGFSGVTFWPDLPNKVQSADRDRVRGHVLSNGIDANGRVIGFVFAGAPAGPDGSEVFVDEALLARSVNARLLEAGHAYPAFYATLPASLRTHLAGLSRAARGARPALGLWPRSTADPNGAATIARLTDAEQLVIWPKLFRRVVPYLAAGFGDFNGFDAWLRADPINRDDELFLLDRMERGNMHDVVRGVGRQIQLTVWPEDFIISPDPAPVGSGGGPRPTARGHVLIVAALPDPAGTDRGRESVTLLNTTASSVNLDSWSLADAAGGRQALGGSVAGGAALQVPLRDTIQLGNRGDTIKLVDPQGQVLDQVAYQPNQVHPGRTICFGR